MGDNLCRLLLFVLSAICFGSVTATSCSAKPADPTPVTTIGILNTNMSASPNPTYYTFGLPFAVGVVPSTASVQIKEHDSSVVAAGTVIPCQFDDRAVWDD